MAREQGLDPYKLVRTGMFDALSSDFGLASRTVSSSSQDPLHGSFQRNLNIFSHSLSRNVDAANMPIFVEGTHKSEVLSTSRNYNTGVDSKILPSTVRLHNIQSIRHNTSAALEALQNYGKVTQSPLHSSLQKDRNVDYHKNINSPAENFPAFSTGGLKSKDPYMHDVESPSKHSSDTPCQPFNDLNLKNVDEEDEFLYGDSNSLPEIPRSVKKDPDEGSTKPNVGWSDDEDLFGESSKSKLNQDQMEGSTVWSFRKKDIGSKLLQVKTEENMRSSSNRNMPSKTSAVDIPYHSSATSTELQTARLLPTEISEKSFKTTVSDKDLKVSLPGVKSKYHVAAQVLRKEMTEKSKLYGNKTTGFSRNDSDDTKCYSKPESFKNDTHENEFTTKSNVQVKDSKELKTNRPSAKNTKKLPKAFIQNIKDYIKGPERKRVHPSEEYEHDIKHARHDSYRDLSPSRRNSPYESRRRSPVNEHRHSPYHSRHKSPGSDLRYRSSPHHSKHKSPHRDFERRSYEHSPRHYEGHKQHYSRSPGRTRERGPGYYKYKARSPGLRRSRERSRSPGMHRSRERSRSPGMHRSRERSRSPGYYRSRDRSQDHKYKKDFDRSREAFHKSTSENSKSKKSKNVQDYSSDDSFCSLSFESQSGSSDSSDDSSDEKKKISTKCISKKEIPENTKSSKMDSSKVEKEASKDVHVKNSDTPLLPDDISLKLDDFCKFQDKAIRDVDINNEVFKSLNKEEEDKLMNIVKRFEDSKIISELVEGVQAHSSTFASPVPSLDVTHNAATLPTPVPPVPNLAFPSMACSQSYPVMPPVRIPFPPQLSSFPPLTFQPPPVIPPVPATSIYGPFPVPVPLSSIPPVEVCRTLDTKQGKKRPSTLRPINITTDITTKSSKECSQPSPVKTSEPTDKIVQNNRAVSENSADESVSKQDTALIEKYKKLKTERHLAHIKVNSARDDIVEMKKMMEDAWGKKVCASERVFQSKCKNLLSQSLDSVSYCCKEAKRLDEDLNQLKVKLPSNLQEKLGNIKVELPKVDNSTEIYSCFDSSNHICYVCYKQFPKLIGILEHFHSSEHKERMRSDDKEWVKKFKKPEQNVEGKKIVLKPVAGIGFIKPFTGYFCTLCSETLLDSATAEQHLKSHDHFWQFKDYVLKNPLYERKCLFKKYIQHSIFSKDKKKKELEDKEQQLSIRKEADEKVKEMIRDQKSKEKVLTELEDEDDADSPTAKNPNLTGIKLTLSGEKEKSKQNEKEKGTKASATKTIQKVVYIGKAPNFKSRPKPWYKRDVYQKNAESSSDTSAPPLPNIKLSETEKVSIPVKQSLANEPEVSTETNQNFLVQGISETVKKKERAIVNKSVESTCLTEEESNNLNTSSSNLINIPKPPPEKISSASSETGKSSESKIASTSSETVTSSESITSIKQSMHKEKDTCNQLELTTTQNTGKTAPPTENQAVNQALKNILLGTDSSVHQNIPLSEIQLPDIPIPSSSSSSTYSTLHGESNIPVPMEIDDTPDKSISDFNPKLMTEEDRDFFILGINREDFKPLVIPVPPPSSLLNSSPTHKPNVPHLNPTHDSPCSRNNINKYADGSMTIPVSISTHLSKSSSPKKQTIESKANKNNRILITIVPTNDPLKLDASLQSGARETRVTSEDLMGTITECGAGESVLGKSNDAIDKYYIPTQDINIENGVGACETPESVNKETSGDSEDFGKELNIATSVSDLCDAETASLKSDTSLQSGAGETKVTSEDLMDTVTECGVGESILEKPKDAAVKSCVPTQDVNKENSIGACKTAESVNKETSGDSEDFGKELNIRTSFSDLCDAETAPLKSKTSLQSDAGETKVTSEDLMDNITECGADESVLEKPKDAADKACVPTQDVNKENSTGACETAESVNKETSGDSEDLGKELNIRTSLSDLCDKETASLKSETSLQSGARETKVTSEDLMDTFTECGAGESVLEKPKDAADKACVPTQDVKIENSTGACETAESVNKETSGDSEDLGKELNIRTSLSDLCDKETASLKSETSLQSGARETKVTSEDLMDTFTECGAGESVLEKPKDAADKACVPTQDVKIENSTGACETAESVNKETSGDSEDLGKELNIRTSLSDLCDAETASLKSETSLQSGARETKVTSEDLMDTFTECGAGESVLEKPKDAADKACAPTQDVKIENSIGACETAESVNKETSGDCEDFEKELNTATSVSDLCDAETASLKSDTYLQSGAAEIKVSSEDLMDATEYGAGESVLEKSNDAADKACFLQSGIGETKVTSDDLMDTTEYGAGEAVLEKPKDAADKACGHTQDPNEENSNGACETAESVNKETSGDSEDFEKELNTATSVSDLCDAETASLKSDTYMQSGAAETKVSSEDLMDTTEYGSGEAVLEKPKDGADKACVPTQDLNKENSIGSCETAEIINKGTSGDSEDFGKELNIAASVSDLFVAETAKDQITEKICFTNEFTSASNNVILKSKPVEADNACISKSKSCDSFDLENDGTEIKSKVPASKDQENGVLVEGMNPHEVTQNSSVNNNLGQMTSVLDSDLTPHSVVFNPKESVSIISENEDISDSAFSKSVSEVLSISENAMDYEVKEDLKESTSQTEEQLSERPQEVSVCNVVSKKGSFDSENSIECPPSQVVEMNVSQLEQKYDSSKESTSDIKICMSMSESVEVNTTASVSKSSANSLASCTDSNSEQSVPEYVSSNDYVKLEITPQQQIVFVEESQCDVQSNEELNSVQLSNQDVCKENISNLTECQLHHPNETEPVRSTFDMPVCSSDFTSDNLSVGICSGTHPSDIKQSLSELQPMKMKENECLIISDEGFVSQQSSNQLDSISDKTTLCSVDAISPEIFLKDLKLVKDSIIRETEHKQEASWQQCDLISESIPTVKTKHEETLPERNTSLSNLIDLEIKTGNTELKSSLLSSSPGDVVETQNLTKSDTDTDEYETED